MTADSDGLSNTGVSIVRADESELTAPSDILIRGGRIVEVAGAGSDGTSSLEAEGLEAALSTEAVSMIDLTGVALVEPTVA